MDSKKCIELAGKLRSEFRSSGHAGRIVIEAADVLTMMMEEIKQRDSLIQRLRAQVVTFDDLYQQTKSMCEDFDQYNCCPKCFSQDVELVYPAGEDDFGAFKCNNCGHQGEIGEDFPDGTAIRSQLADAVKRAEAAEAVVPRTCDGVPYQSDMPCCFLDDDMSHTSGNVHSWNDEYAIIDTNNDRYTVQHNHVFREHHNAEQAAIAARQGGEG